jgi:hypothetical protein
MLNPFWLVVLIVSTGAALYGLWKFWKRQINFISRPKSLAAALLLFLFSLFPAVFIFDSLSSGVVRCLSKGCDSIYAIQAQAQLFWMNISIFYLVFLALFTAAVYAAYGFARGEKRGPNNALKGDARR